jgi:hypothetical protein
MLALLAAAAPRAALAEQGYVAPVVDEAAKKAQLESRVAGVEAWVRTSCPEGQYWECFVANPKYRVSYGDNKDLIIHMGRYLREAALNPYSSEPGEDTCVVLPGTKRNTFQIVVVSFLEKEACEAAANASWPRALSTVNTCENQIGGWGRYFRIEYGKEDTE